MTSVFTSVAKLLKTLSAKIELSYETIWGQIRDLMLNLQSGECIDNEFGMDLLLQFATLSHQQAFPETEKKRGLRFAEDDGQSEDKSGKQEAPVRFRADWMNLAAELAKPGLVVKDSNRVQLAFGLKMLEIAGTTKPLAEEFYPTLLGSKEKSAALKLIEARVFSSQEPDPNLARLATLVYSQYLRHETQAATAFFGQINGLDSQKWFLTFLEPLADKSSKDDRVREWLSSPGFGSKVTEVVRRLLEDKTGSLPQEDWALGRTATDNGKAVVTRLFRSHFNL